VSRSDLIVERIIAREGGFVNRAEDRGGPTNWGITIGTLGEWRNMKATVADVQALTRLEAALIYKVRYIAPFEGVKHDDLFDLVVDTAVNNGRGRAAQWLQRAVGVVEDGSIGPISLAKINASPSRAYFDLCAVRMKAYGALISQNHSQAVFAAGWMNRLAEFVARDIIDIDLPF
jgi:lysozyme family protein